MTAVIYRLVFAWDWLMGLRFSTQAQRDATAAQIDGLTVQVRNAVGRERRASMEKREAQRLLAIISEPLKDWDLADFPDIIRDHRGQLTLSEENVRHLERVLDGYRPVASAAAQARMSVVFNDQVRSRGYGDRDLGSRLGVSVAQASAGAQAFGAAVRAAADAERHQARIRAEESGT